MQVNITKRIDTPEGKRYCPVVVGPNGRIKPDSVMVDGRQEKHPEGAYYLDWTEDERRKRIASDLMRPPLTTVWSRGGALFTPAKLKSVKQAEGNSYTEGKFHPLQKWEKTNDLIA